jgi:hypothetical protein
VSQATGPPDALAMFFTSEGKAFDQYHVLVDAAPSPGPTAQKRGRRLIPASDMTNRVPKMLPIQPAVIG